MVSQVDVFSKLCKFVAKEHPNATVRQMNALIQAANIVVEAFSRDDLPVTPGQGLVAWLSGDKVGLSSKFMASCLSGSFTAEYNFPHDPGDLGRCLGLLEAVPEYVSRVPEMANTGKEWAGLVKHWDEIVRLYHEEKAKSSGRPTKCYDLMKKAISGC